MQRSSHPAADTSIDEDWSSVVNQIIEDLDANSAESETEDDDESDAAGYVDATEKPVADAPPTDPKPAQMHLTQTAHGYPKLCIDGHMFYFIWQYPDQRVYWQCSRTAIKCPARAITASISAGHVPRLLTPPAEHNHANAADVEEAQRKAAQNHVGVSLVKSLRGHQILCVDGHLYHCHNKTKHHIRWFCIERRRASKCMAQALTEPLTDGDVPKLIGSTDEHSHAPGAAASQIKAARSCSTAGKQFKTTTYISQVSARIVAVRSPHPDVDPPMNETQPNADADAVACSESMELDDVDATAETGQSRTRTSNKHEFGNIESAGAEDTVCQSRIDDLNANSAEYVGRDNSRSSYAHAKFIGNPAAKEPTIDPEPAQLQLAKTKNGGTKLCIDGFTFYSSNQNSDKQVYWQCSRAKHKCPARAITASISAGHVPRLLSAPAEHNHEPYVNIEARNVLRRPSSSSVVRLEDGCRGGRVLYVDGHTYHCCSRLKNQYIWTCIERHRKTMCTARAITQPLTGRGVPKLIGFIEEHSHAPEVLGSSSDARAKYIGKPVENEPTIDPEPAQLQLAKTKNGGSKLCIDGYTFYSSNQNSDKQVYWVCSRHTRKCPARVYTSSITAGHVPRLLSPPAEHNHVPYVDTSDTSVLRQASSSSVVSLETGGRGGQILCVDGHSYYCQQKNNHYTSWMCIEKLRAPKCMARVTTEPLTGRGVPKLIGFTNDHSHAPGASTSLNKAKRATVKTRQTKQDPLFASPSPIVDDLEANSDAAEADVHESDDHPLSEAHLEPIEKPVSEEPPTDPKPAQLQLTQTANGCPKLCIDGSMFYFIWQYSDRRVFWKCLRSRQKCPASAITSSISDGLVPRLLTPPAEHNHATDVVAQNDDRRPSFVGVSLVKSSRGGLILRVDGHSYHCQKKTKHQTTWLCIERHRASKCMVRVTTKPQTGRAVPRLIGFTGEHSHASASQSKARIVAVRPSDHPDVDTPMNELKPNADADVLPFSREDAAAYSESMELDEVDATTEAGQIRTTSNMPDRHAQQKFGQVKGAGAEYTLVASRFDDLDANSAAAEVDDHRSMPAANEPPTDPKPAQLQLAKTKNGTPKLFIDGHKFYFMSQYPDQRISWQCSHTAVKCPARAITSSISAGRRVPRLLTPPAEHNHASDVEEARRRVTKKDDRRPSSVGVSLVKSNRGGQILGVDGHSYHCWKETKHHTTWVCIERRRALKCPARVSTKSQAGGGVPKLIGGVTSKHNHAPGQSKASRSLATFDIRDKTMLTNVASSWLPVPDRIVAVRQPSPDQPMANDDVKPNIDADVQPSSSKGAAHSGALELAEVDATADEVAQPEPAGPSEATLFASGTLTKIALGAIIGRVLQQERMSIVERRSDDRIVEVGGARLAGFVDQIVDELLNAAQPARNRQVERVPVEPAIQSPDSSSTLQVDEDFVADDDSSETSDDDTPSERTPQPSSSTVVRMQSTQKPPNLLLLQTNDEGHPLLCVDGYRFNRIGVNVEEPKRSYWVCVHRMRGKRGCRSKAITIEEEDSEVGLRLLGHSRHTHAPRADAVRSRVVLEDMAHV